MTASDLGQQVQEARRVRWRRTLWGLGTAASFVLLTLALRSPPASPYPVVAYLPDGAGASLEAVRALPPAAWTSVDPRRLSVPAAVGREAWLRVHMPPEAKEQRWVAEVMTPHLREVDFYVASAGNLVSSLQGMDRPFDERPYHFMYHAFGFTKQAGVAHDLYVRAKSDIYIYLPLQLLHEDVFYGEMVTRNMVLGLLFGIFSGIVLYNLCICISLRDRVYLYYCLFEIGIVIIGGLWSGEAHLFSPFLATHFDLGFRAIAVALGGVSIFFALFIQEFAQLKYTDAAANRLVAPFIAVMVPTTLVAQFLPLHILLTVAAAAAALGACAVMVGIAMRAKTQREFFLFLSFAGLGSCVFIHLATTSALLPHSLFSEYAIFVGGVWEALFFSLALADRIKTMQVERKAIISSLKGDSPVSDLNGILGSSFTKTIGLSEMNVTIMFVDIVGFSQTSELLGSHEVFKRLSQLMRDVSTIVRDCDGTVDRSLGDGVLCFFGYERGVRLHHHAQDAFKAAKRIQQLIVTQVQPGEQEFVLPVRIGIHVADVLIGDLGGVQRVDFTMIGSGVNFASRLEAACSPFKIMVSEECFHHLGKADMAGFSPILVALKHQDHLVKAYEFNPFAQLAAPLARVEKLHLEQLHLKPHEYRYEVTGSQPVLLKSAFGTFQILDFSAHGFRVIGDTYVGRKATMLMELSTFDDAINQALRSAMLHAFYVEVRWSRCAPSGYEHGLRVYGLNPEQSLQIFHALEHLFKPYPLNRIFEDLGVAS